MSMDCIFCKIIAKEIPAKILYEDEDTISFLDAFPVTKGHTLVIPKQHFPQIQDMSSKINEKLFKTLHKMISKVDSVKGSTLVLIHNGKDSGQEIMHVHVHLIPRGSDDSGDSLDVAFHNKPKFSESEINSVFDKLKIS
jgi:histidine triad (HIT) family protein|tara:strand:- start:1610 stop:2026 length:417 start_codon:yes stop_codon:yes gene_type:complete